MHKGGAVGIIYMPQYTTKSHDGSYVVYIPQYFWRALPNASFERVDTVLMIDDIRQRLVH